MSIELPLQPTSVEIYESKYQLKTIDGRIIDKTIDDSYERVANTLVKNEKTDFQQYWKSKFIYAMRFGTTPAGRILANIGSELYKPKTSSLNCLVSKNIEDSIDGILDAVKRAAISLSKGSGIGYCLSSLRPKGAYINGVGATTSGSMSFALIFDIMCFTINSAGGRRGAQMGTHFCFHPDIEEFIMCKRERGKYRQFNFSVLITNEFLEAVKNDEDWDLYFPVHKKEYEANKENLELFYKEFPFDDENYIVHEQNPRFKMCKIYKVLKARYLWDLITKSTYDFSDPGILFYDNINYFNNNWFCETITATNPCFTGDTKVWTDKGPIAFKELAESGNSVNVLTEINGKLVYRLMKNPRMTQRNAELRKTIFTNSDSVRSTPEHVFYLKNGDGVKAKKLTLSMELRNIREDDSIRVLYGEELEEREDVYCGTVEETGKFFISIGNDNEGILVSNCGEIPLQPDGACLLGSVNLTKFVINPLMDNANFNFEKFEELVAIFARMLDNVVEFNGLALQEQITEIVEKRRHGMGYYGLGSTLALLKIRYGSKESIEFTEKLTEILTITNYEVGHELAKEKGMAPILERMFNIDENIEIKNRLSNLPKDIYNELNISGNYVSGLKLYCISNFMLERIRPNYYGLWKNILNNGGIRFTHSTTIAPTGTTSLSIGNNASNGIEPSFLQEYSRNIIKAGKKTKEQVKVKSYEKLVYDSLFGETEVENLPSYFISANSVTPEEHIAVQAAAQKWIDNSISKTINCSSDIEFEKFQNIYNLCHSSGLKGCATYRYNPESQGGVLVNDEELKNIKYEFKLQNGETITVSANDEIEYDGDVHNAANLYESLKEGYYGKL